MLESPKIARTVTGPIFFVIVSDPEVAQLVYNSSPLKPETFYYILEPWLGKGIILSKGFKILSTRFYADSCNETNYRRRYAIFPVGPFPDKLYPTDLFFSSWEQKEVA